MWSGQRPDHALFPWVHRIALSLPLQRAGSGGTLRMVFETKVLLDGLTLPEGPRWHDGKLWFSDFFTHRVMTVDLDGHAEAVVEVPGQPSGLGWLPDGRLLVVSMMDRRLMRLDPEGLVEVANLSGLASYHCNDMVVDSQGRAYIGNFGFDLSTPEPVKLAEIVMVTPEGDARVVADEMAFPNGSVITPDGGRLIVAESAAARLTAFDIQPDGSLSGRRVWAAFDDRGVLEELEEYVGRVGPDGMCLDAEGAIWVASPSTGEVLRVREGGEVVHRFETETLPYACMLGGHDRRMLFALTAETADPSEALAKESGRVEMVEVDVPGAGLP
jgi:sugar lactone lactonase YvrE